MWRCAGILACAMTPAGLTAQWPECAGPIFGGRVFRSVRIDTSTAQCKCSTLMEVERAGYVELERFPDGSIRELRALLQGGAWRQEVGFFQNGDLRFRIDARGVGRKGGMEEFYPCGGLKTRISLRGCQNHGAIWHWNEHGKLVRRDRYRNGRYVRGRTFR